MAAKESAHKANANAESSAQEAPQDCQQLTHDMAECLKLYARDNPGTVALWCLGIGFVLGWKLKPW